MRKNAGHSAKIIRADDKIDFKAPLVPFAQQPAGVRPLFFAPTVSGQIADYFYLSELLTGTVPMYGLQMRGLRDGEQVHDNLRDAAEFYIQRMREVQPKGPYSLAGYSAGGTVCLASECVAKDFTKRGRMNRGAMVGPTLARARELTVPFVFAIDWSDCNRRCLQSELTIQAVADGR